MTFDVTDDQWDVTTPALQGNLDDGHCAAIHAVVCSEKHVCTAGGDCVIRVWNRTTLKPESSMIGHRGPVFALVLLGVLRCHHLPARFCAPTHAMTEATVSEQRSLRALCVEMLEELVSSAARICKSG